MDLNEKIMIESKLNISEKIAYNWLKKKYKYSFDDITKQDKTPDFLCKDGKSFEVKALYYKNTLMFSEKQINSLTDDDIIIVVDTNKKIVEDNFKWEDRATKEWKIYIPKKNYQTLRLGEDTYKRFKRVKSLLEFQNNKEYSISEFLDSLLDLLKPRI